MKPWNVRRLPGRWFADTMFMDVKSLEGNKCAQLFTNNKYVFVYPMVSKSQAGQALQTFIQLVGVPDHLTYDNAKEQVQPGTDFAAAVRKHHINYHHIEPYKHRENRAEPEIGMLK